MLKGYNALLANASSYTCDLVGAKIFSVMQAV